MNMQECSVGELDDDQGRALALMLAGHNVFLTGKAGTGKTAVIHEFKRNCVKRLALLAPTGRAAINIKGQTIHHFLNLPVGSPILEVVKADMEDDELRDKLEAVDIILIDEVSMVPPHIFQEVDRCCRAAAQGSLKGEPFGGKQIIASGDFLQLGAVIDSPTLKKWLTEQFGGVHAFDAHAWKEARFEVVSLDQVHRQSDKEEVKILDAVRTGELVRSSTMIYGEKWLGEDYAIDDEIDYLHLLNMRCHTPGASPSPNAITLCARRNTAFHINDSNIRTLTGNAVQFVGNATAGFPRMAYPTGLIMCMKIWTRVMILANNHAQGYVNGDMGTLVAADPPKATVMLDKGFEVKLDKFKWTSFRYEVMPGEDGKAMLMPIPVGEFYQTPLAPAYAMTIHKAQGLTLDAAHIALGDGMCFMAGQLYTGVSRTRSLGNLSIDRPLREEECLVDPEVVEFYDKTIPKWTGDMDEPLE